MKNIFTLLTVLSMAACNGGGGGATETAKLPNIEQPGAPDQPADPGNPPENVTLTTYTLSLTEAPVNGWVNKTYTATGTCTQYNAKTYCWDDGVQIIDFTSNNFRYGPYTYTFFRLQSGPANCYGACVDDLLVQPTLIEGNVEAAINVATVSNVLANGTPETANCTKTGNTIDCGDFSVEVQ